MITGSNKTEMVFHFQFSCKKILFVMKFLSGPKSKEGKKKPTIKLTKNICRVEL